MSLTSSHHETISLDVPAELAGFGAHLLTAMERAADRVARALWLEGRAQYYIEDAVATEEGVDALGTHTERVSDDLVVAGVVGRKPQNWFIEYGRRPGPLPLEDPPEGAEDDAPYPEIIVRWMKRKGMTPRDGTTERDYRDAARAIGWNLLHNGYEERAPVTHGIEALVADGKVERLIHDSVMRSLRARRLI